MEFAVLGWPEDGPQLRLDHERFAYAGKFVMSNTGKAVAREDGEGTISEDEEVDGGDEIVAAVAFNEDRTDPATAWLRYVTVAADRRGERIGPRLVRFTVERLDDRGFERVKIAVNNPFAYQACYRAGFGYTGETTGIAELVLARPGDRSRVRYQSGLDAYRERDGLSADEESFLETHRDADVPEVLDPPDGVGPSRSL